MTRATLLIVLACSLVATARAQTLQQRIDHVRQRQSDAQELERMLQRSIGQRLHNVLEHVVIQGASARDAFDWWSRSTHISLVINWDAMLQEGVDPDTPINVELRYIPADQLLELMLRAAAPPHGLVEFVYDVEPGYIHVMTKSQANRMPVTRVYDVLDLLMDIPTFDDAPSFDLREALSNTSTGGGGDSGGGSNASTLFGDQDSESQSREPQLTKTQRGERLAQLVRDTIEPTIWRESGGDVAAIRYFDGRLIVTAPKYVHRQIGIPVRTPGLPPIGGSFTAGPTPVPAD